MFWNDDRLQGLHLVVLNRRDELFDALSFVVGVADMAEFEVVVLGAGSAGK